MALLDKNQIMEIIPHRDPFLLIDEVEELEIGKRVVAKKIHRSGFVLVPGTLSRTPGYAGGADR